MLLKNKYYFFLSRCCVFPLRRVLLYITVCVLSFLHCESKKLDPFSFEHKFRKYCPILIILSLLQTEIISPQTYNRISHFTDILLLHYLAKCNRKNCWIKSAMHAAISLLLQNRKFWWYLLLTSSMLLHDVMLRPAIRRVSGNDFVFQQDSAPAHCAAHVQQMNCCVKKRQTFLRSSCGLQTAPISVLWIVKLQALLITSTVPNM